jgi:hypothetical protein
MAAKLKIEKRGYEILMFIKNPVIYAKKLIIMLTQFKFGHNFWQFWPFEEISIFSNSGAVGHNFERDSPRDHPRQVWFNLVQWFQRRRFKCAWMAPFQNGVR